MVKMLRKSSLKTTIMKNKKNHKQDTSMSIDTSTGRDQQSKDNTPIYATNDSTLQTPEEHQHDESVDPRKSSSIDVSNDDLRETKADRLAGSDRAGTAERKDNSL
jgi:hypothetical protein